MHDETWWLYIVLLSSVKPVRQWNPPLVDYKSETIDWWMKAVHISLTSTISDSRYLFQFPEINRHERRRIVNQYWLYIMCATQW